MMTSHQPKHMDPLEGTTYRARGALYTFKALATDTGGAYTLSTAENPPGTGVPPHIQHQEDEAFFVLAGTYTMQVGDRTLACGPGAFVFVPRGTAHAFQNTGSAPARLLILQSPGGLHERYFAEAWEPIADPAHPPVEEPAPDFRKVGAAAQRYGIEILLPPPQG